MAPWGFGEQMLPLIFGSQMGAPEQNESTRRSIARHNGRANISFCDGHVESPALEYLFEETSDAALSRWNREYLPHREKLPP
jgi:prepilin-type processing-associated H-X9-DG protein